MSKKPISALSQLNLTPEIYKMMETAKTSLAAGPALLAAIEKNDKAIENARAEYDEAANKLAEAEADCAICDSEEQFEQKSQAAIKALEAVDKKRAALDREERLTKALKNRIATIDLGVEDARLKIDQAMGALNNKALAIVSEDIADAVKPLCDALARAYAVNRILRIQGLTLALSEMRIPNPASWDHCIVAGDQLMVNGACKTISQSGLDDPAIVELTEKFQQVQEVRSLLSKHQQIVFQQKPTHSGYIISSGNGVG